MDMASSPAHHGLQQALDAATARYVRRNSNSKALHDEATQHLPGGGTRSVLHVDPFPLSLKSGRGCMVTTEDGQDLVDLLGDFTAGLYGHSHPVIQGVAKHVLDDVGLHMGGTAAQERLFAGAVCRRFGLELVRFTSSGTEANLHALAAARHFSKKRKIVVFANGYHGSVLGFARGQPAANNVDVDDWVVAEYNDLESTAEAIRSPGVAAVLIEGMQSAAGCVCGTPEFLACVEQTASEVGVLFILDEVATSRLSAGGLAGTDGLKPDLKTLGKWLGGGAAFGAFGGRADIMAAFDARRAPGGLAHSGTFNNNTLAMHLGHAGLTRIYTPRAADDFTASGDELRARLNAATGGTGMRFTGRGTLMNAHFAAGGDVTTRLRDLWWFSMLEAGFWVGRRGLVALVLGTPRDALDSFVECVGDFASRNRGLFAPEG